MSPRPPAPCTSPASSDPSCQPRAFIRGRGRPSLRLRSWREHPAAEFRGPSPLPQPSLDRLAGDDRGWPLERGSLRTQGRVDVLREGKVKVLHGAYRDGSLHATMLWHRSWYVKRPHRRLQDAHSADRRLQLSLLRGDQLGRPDRRGDGHHAPRSPARAAGPEAHCARSHTGGDEGLRRAVSLRGGARRGGRR